MLGARAGGGAEAGAECERHKRHRKASESAGLPDILLMYSDRTISYRLGSVEGGSLSSLKRPSHNELAIRNIAG